MKIFVFDKINSKFFVLWHKTFWTFDGQFSQFCPNTLLRVHSNGLRMGFFEIYFVFYIISNFELNCSDFAHQISRSLSTLLSNSLQEIFDDNFLMTIFLQEMINLFFVFGVWPKFLLNFHNYLSAGLPKLHFTFLVEDLKECNCFLKRITFSNFTRFGSQIFQNVCEWFRAKISKLVSTCQEDSEEQLRSKKSLYFNFCLIFSANFFDFSEKLWLPKLQFTCPGGIIFGLVPFKKGNHIIATRHRSESHRNFDEIFRGWLSNLHSKSLEEVFDDICFW